MQGRVHTYYEYRPCGGLICWQLCETHEQEERLTHRVDHIDFAHAMTMMGIVGAGTPSADTSTSATARTMTAALCMRFKWTADQFQKEYLKQMKLAFS